MSDPVQVVIREGLVVNPGDTLVVLIPYYRDDNLDTQEFGKQVQDLLPEGAKVAVLHLDPESAIAVVRKGEVDV